MCLKRQDGAVLEDTSTAPADSEPLREAFKRGTGHGLLFLGINETGTVLPPDLAYWRDFAALFIRALCRTKNLEEHRETIEIPFPREEAGAFPEKAPPMSGGAQLSVEFLERIWLAVLFALRAEIAGFSGSVQEFLRARNPAWNLVGRVILNLAENPKTPTRPFALLVTYTTELTDQAKPLHSPLSDALRTYAGAKNKAALLSLLTPIHKGAQACPLLRRLVESGDIFRPLSWTSSQTYEFLVSIPQLEAAGLVCRVPDWWRGKSAHSLRVVTDIGGKPPSQLGLDALLDFSVDLCLDGTPLSREEWKAIAETQERLALVRGKWVEIDREKLDEALKHWETLESRYGASGITLLEGMKLLAGAGSGGTDTPEGTEDWVSVRPGGWLERILETLREPRGLEDADPGPGFSATLRPYQRDGLKWLLFLSRMQLGACLADDMGLGKTIQILAMISFLKGRPSAAPTGSPHLLVVPASLLGNWSAEIQRFAPHISALVLHPSAGRGNLGDGPPPPDFARHDLVMTSYGFASRLEWLKDVKWDLLILDEAQAIKNPDAKTTRAIKKFHARHRIVLTGTPVENRLGDLWSIFDFLNPGLLGTPTEFNRFVKKLQGAGKTDFSPVRALVRPYILRRMKTDPKVISDLPAKTEIEAYCPLSREQAVMYQTAVEGLARELEGTDGIQRKGLVLAYLLRFKQICNHPSNWLHSGTFDPDASGKFGRLREIAETISEAGEKALVFTQFREMTEPLSGFLAEVFGAQGLILHGQTPVKDRPELVARFQDDPSVPFMVLSLKAGGVGLNLTAASHVVHFDRWWNPAVENQATDRAFRIGQKKNVLVHKFICRGTIEERINMLLSTKQRLADDILSGGAEAVLATELSDKELIDLVTLDLQRAIQENP